MHAKNTPTGAPTPAPARDGLATQADACAFLQVSRQYLWLRARSGHIHPIKFGRLVRYKWSEIQAIAANGIEGGAK